MSGIFGLGEVRAEQLNNTWPESANYGYFAGGDAPDKQCTIDRIDFSTETVTLPASSLTQARSAHATVSSPNYGYFAGGNIPTGYVFSADRIDFSNESIVSVGSVLTKDRNSAGGVSVLGYGYFAGGNTTPGYVSDIDRLDFSTETAAYGTSLATLSDVKSSMGRVYTPNYGYFAGGYSPGVGRFCTIERIDFSTESVGLIADTITKRNHIGSVHSSGYGYFAGGYESGYIDIIERIEFSTETVSTTDQLTEARYSLAAVFNSKYGYFGGGVTTGSSYVCTIDRIDFSTETVSGPPVHGANLTEKRNYFAAVSGGKSINARQQYGTPYFSSKLSEAKYGYLMDGYVNEPAPILTCNIERFDYSNETITNTGNYSKGGWGVVTVSTPNYGYGLGGITHCAISRFDFSNESYIETFIQYGSKVSEGSSTVNANYGYFSRNAAQPSSPTYPDNTLKRLDFSNEVFTSLPNWSSNKRGLMIGMSSKNHGYFWGGGGTFDNGPPSGFPSDSQMERLEFSTEIKSTPITSLSAFPTPEAEKYYGGSGRSFSITDYGYMGNRYDPRHLRYPGGINHRDIIRFEFSNETLSAPGVLQNNYMAENTTKIHSGDNGYGYDVGGYEYPYNPHTTPRSCVVDRFDFSNETYSGLLAGASLVGSRRGLSGYTDTFQNNR